MSQLEVATIQSRPYLDYGRLERHFPNARDAAHHLFDGTEDDAWEDMKRNPEAAKKWHAETYMPNLAALENIIIPRLIEILAARTFGFTPQAASQMVSRITNWLHDGFHYSRSLESRKVMHEAYRENPLLAYCVDVAMRSIQLKWFLAMSRDPRFQAIVEHRIAEFGKKYLQVMDNPATAQIFRAVNPSEACIADARIFKKQFELQKGLEYTQERLQRLRAINDALAADIEEHQETTIADCYNRNTTLARRPFLTLFQCCENTPLVGWEGDITGLLSMRPDIYEKKFVSGELKPEELGTGAALRREVQKVLDVSQPRCIEQDIQREIVHMVDEREGQGLSVPCIISDTTTLLFMITRDWKLRMPESSIDFAELFGAAPSDTYLAEVLRFHLLWRIRALTCPNAPRAGSMTTLRDLPTKLDSIIMPRVLHERITGDIAAHPVKGHIRMLPEGWYASPNAVEAAARAGRLHELPYEETPDGRRYTATFVRDYNHPGRKIS